MLTRVPPFTLNVHITSTVEHTSSGLARAQVPAGPPPAAHAFGRRQVGRSRRTARESKQSGRAAAQLHPASARRLLGEQTRLRNRSLDRDAVGSRERSLQLAPCAPTPAALPRPTYAYGPATAHLLEREGRPVQQACAVGDLGGRALGPHLVDAREEGGWG
jgi:hypothetical protein